MVTRRNFTISTVGHFAKSTTRMVQLSSAQPPRRTGESAYYRCTARGSP
jgi:hypothetical protein